MNVHVVSQKKIPIGRMIFNQLDEVTVPSFKYIQTDITDSVATHYSFDRHIILHLLCTLICTF
jgi:hypothetical protein